MMNDRQRMDAILDGQPPDRIPWIPRMEIWYAACNRTGTMPRQWQGQSLRQIERALGVGTPARGGRVYETHTDGVDVTVSREGSRHITEYHTPVGSVRQVRDNSDEGAELGLPGLCTEHVLKGPSDYRVWEWIVQQRTYSPAYDAYRAYDADIGGDGLPMVGAGGNPFYDFLQDLAGYNNAYYQLADHPREIEHLLAVMTEVQREQLWPIVADSPAKLLINGAHLSSQLTPPPVFEKYILPYYDEFMPLMHAAGKKVAMHADADATAILALIERAGWDMVECFVTAPMVPLTLANAREAWGDRVIIWGGLPCVMLEPHVKEEDFRQYVRGILDAVAPGDAFILGVADNVMPTSLIDRIAWVSEQVESCGRLPIGQRCPALSRATNRRKRARKR